MLLFNNLASGFLIYLSAVTATNAADSETAVSARSSIVKTLAADQNIITTFATITPGQVSVSITFDALGNCYTTNTYSVLKRDVTTGITTVVAGSLDLSFGSSADNLDDGVLGVAVDAEGHVYFGNLHRIRKIDATTRILTTVAGQILPGFTGDGGPGPLALLNLPTDLALHKSGNLYIADSRNNRIRNLNTITGIITTVAGGDSGSYFGNNIPAKDALLNDPFGVAVDDEENVFIADTNNGCIRKVTSGIITTVAGTCAVLGANGVGGPVQTTPLYSPIAVATTPSGNFYVLDFNNIMFVNVITDTVSVFAGNRQFQYLGDGIPATATGMDPKDLALDKAGNVYAPDSRSNRIYKISVPSEQPTTPPPTTPPPTTPPPTTPPPTTPPPTTPPSLSCESAAPTAPPSPSCNLPTRTKKPRTKPTKKPRCPTIRPTKCKK